MNQVNIDRVGQISALTNISRQKGFLTEVDKVDFGKLLPTFLSTDPYLASIIKGGYTEDVQSSGMLGG